MDDVTNQMESEDDLRKRRRVIALLVGVVVVVAFFLGVGANWAVRMTSEPSVYCLDQSELQDGRYQLYANDSGCTPGEVCVLIETGIVSQELRATDCGGSPDLGSGS